MALIESPAYRSLSINARRTLDRLVCEHFRQNRLENGALRVSARQFHEWGVTKDCLTDEIKELEERGLVEVSLGEAIGVLRAPFIFRRTFYGRPDSKPTNEWMRWNGECWPNTPIGPAIIDVPKSRAGEAGKSGSEIRSKVRRPPRKVGTVAGGK